MTKIVDVSVVSELYVAGTTEDGQEYHAERYLVQVEYADGTRLVHNNYFNGCRYEFVNDEGYYGPLFHDIRPEAKVQAGRLAERVKAALDAGQDINPIHWQATYPVYGSEAYQEEVLNMTQEQRSL